MRGHDGRQAALSFGTLAAAAIVLRASGARIVDLQRFCIRRGPLHTFAFSAAWVVITTPPLWLVLSHIPRLL